MLTVLNPLDDTQQFPNVDNALDDPNGLIAVGGCLSPRRLENAYRSGIFPWYNENEPILWWSPNPRLTLSPKKFRTSRSLRKTLRKGDFQVSFDRAFKGVVEACAAPRSGAKGTWITQEIKQAYVRMHQLGRAHSVETWYQNNLVGGLYGMTIGRVFFGESMFYRRTNASKVALAALAEFLKSWNYALIDCQVQTQHLIDFGAEEISRQEFVNLLNNFCNASPSRFAWKSFVS